jgi:shikimate kinase
MILVVLSGPVCAGKTTVAGGLGPVGVRALTTRGLIAARTGVPAESTSRRRLQELGESLDRTEGGQWVADGVRQLVEVDRSRAVCVDAVRTGDQVAAVRALGPTVHVHLTAPPEVLATRYEARQKAAPDLELPSYAALTDDATERAVQDLSADADLVVDTGQVSVDATLAQVRDRLRPLLG